MAKPWQKFDVLQRVRERQEKLKAQALAETRREIQRAEAQRNALSEEQRRVLEEAGAASKDNVDAAKTQAFIHYERHIARLAVEKDAEIHSLRGVEERRRRELEDAMKKRKVVERLSEKARLDYHTEQRRAEQKQNDETASVQSALERKASRP